MTEPLSVTGIALHVKQHCMRSQHCRRTPCAHVMTFKTPPMPDLDVQEALCMFALLIKRNCQAAYMC
jgi:hypothetical protein